MFIQKGILKIKDKMSSTKDYLCIVFFLIVFTFIFICFCFFIGFVLKYRRIKGDIVVKRERKNRAIFFNNGTVEIKDVFKLEKIGAGHDGYVFRFNEYAIKILKNNIDLQKDRNLMTLDKALDFIRLLEVRRTAKPIDVVWNEDGIFRGYVMQYFEDVSKTKNVLRRKDTGSFLCGELLDSVYELYDDFSNFSKNGVLVSDLNRGSYIYSYDYIHLCDMDKFKILNLSQNVIREKNLVSFNFYIAKLLYLEMLKTGDCSKKELKKLSIWVKKCSNGQNFIKVLENDIGHSLDLQIRDFVNSQKKKILH